MCEEKSCARARVICRLVNETCDDNAFGERRIRASLSVRIWLNLQTPGSLFPGMSYNTAHLYATPAVRIVINGKQRERGRAWNLRRSQGTEFRIRSTTKRARARARTCVLPVRGNPRTIRMQTSFASVYTSLDGGDSPPRHTAENLNLTAVQILPPASLSLSPSLSLFDFCIIYLRLKERKRKKTKWHHWKQRECALLSTSAWQTKLFHLN